MTNLVSAIRKYPWPSGIIAFFLLLTVWHGWLLSTAFSGQPARVTVNAYKDSLVFQERINRRKRAKEAIQKKEIVLTKLTSGQLVSLKIKKEEGYDFSKTMNVQFRRADTSKLDRVVPLTQNEDENSEEITFLGRTQLPVAGLWLLQLNFEINGKKAELEEKIFLTSSLLQ